MLEVKLKVTWKGTSEWDLTEMSHQGAFPGLEGAMS